MFFDVLEEDTIKLLTYDGHLNIYDKDSNVRQVGWSMFMYQIVLTDAPYQVNGGSGAVLVTESDPNLSRFKVPRQRLDNWGNPIDTSMVISN